MPYRFARERPDYSDLASGCVLHSLPGHPAFPIRLASEIYQHCLARRPAGPPQRYTLYDPCCGAAYLLTVLGYLHRDSIGAVIGSDIDLPAIQLARRNLDLLTLAGLDERTRELTDLYGRYGKPSHRAALDSASRLRLQMGAVPAGEPIGTDVFQADVTDGPALRAHLRGIPIDIVLADVPYGRRSHWEGGNNEEAGRMWAMLDGLLGVVGPTSLIALASAKQPNIRHAAYERLEKFQIGKRQVVILRPLNATVTAQKPPLPSPA